ncbi:MAG: hypothetical protein QOE61_4506 [Micromonosporaceae bacterium]|jgi:hypothetical protein|nr:hypothetical protein [Micromonosporaceae bacterium]
MPLRISGTGTNLIRPVRPIPCSLDDRDTHRMPAPSTSPDERGRAQTAPADAYHAGQAVWVYRGSWRPGGVLSASSRAVMVRYTPAAGRGT